VVYAVIVVAVVVVIPESVLVSRARGRWTSPQPNDQQRGVRYRHGEEWM